MYLNVLDFRVHAHVCAHASVHMFLCVCVIHISISIKSIIHKIKRQSKNLQPISELPLLKCFHGIEISVTAIKLLSTDNQYVCF